MGYQGKFSGEQIDERLTNAGDIPDMKADIATLLSNVGKPDVITDAGDFATADHSKVYAYMGETTASYTHEHWYYYKNGAWTDGGVWGSAVAVDAELETEGAAADAKATRAEIDKQNSALLDITGAGLYDADWQQGYFNLSSSVLSVDISSRVSNDRIVSAVIACQPGNKFIVTGTGTAAARTWAFLSSASGADNIIKRRAYTDGTWADNGVVIVAPEGASYLIVNAISRYEHYLIKGEPIADIIATKQDILHRRLDAIEDADCNNITEVGEYYFGSSDNALNTPGSAAAGIVIHYNGKTSATMYQFGFDYTTGYIYKRQKKNSTWGSWIKVLTEIDLPKTPKMVYQAGNTGDALTEQIMVYLPATSGYIAYSIAHFIDNDINCNGWQIYRLYHVDDNLQNALQVSRNGEWECAIRLDGRDDASGGHTHGDEVMLAFSALLNGTPIDYTTLTSVTEFHELRLFETTKMYDPDDHTTAITNHGREWVFTAEKLEVHQSLEWLVANPIEGWHMAMFTPSKNYIDRAIGNTDFEVMTLASDTETRTQTYTKPNATAIDMYDTGGGLSANVSVPVYPTGYTDGDFMRITDNGGGPYNKLYFTIAEGGTSVIGDKVKTTTVYIVDYA